MAEISSFLSFSFCFFVLRGYMPEVLGQICFQQLNFTTPTSDLHPSPPLHTYTHKVNHVHSMGPASCQAAFSHQFYLQMPTLVPAYILSKDLILPLPPISRALPLFLSYGTIHFHSFSQILIFPTGLKLMGSLFGSSGPTEQNAGLGMRQVHK